MFKLGGYFFGLTGLLLLIFAICDVLSLLYFRFYAERRTSEVLAFYEDKTKTGYFRSFSFEVVSKSGATLTQNVQCSVDGDCGLPECRKSGEKILVLYLSEGLFSKEEKIATADTAHCLRDFTGFFIGLVFVVLGFVFRFFGKLAE
jgi:hypothetical protein